ncbi:DUF6093 family protein [Arthrobacter agilis]|uniref:DUF6093 family protein n=1 Tax=Arthrobacter agilis TaxID=37921 RepID=UPI002365FABE|nr:DUF6093 family protein [Arthrobacter agilis]WDF34548.1 DUF6093 family protein [Arthrobacter agilis]
MSVDAILADARRVAESLMTDACVVSRGGGGSVFNPDTGQYEDTATPVYEGKCRLQSVRAQAANPDSGEAVFTVERVELQLPFGTTFHVGDVAEFTASQFSPDMVGLEYRVTGLGRKSQATSQRLNVEVLS